MVMLMNRGELRRYMVCMSLLAFIWHCGLRLVPAQEGKGNSRLTWTVILPKHYLELRPSDQPLLAVTVFGDLMTYRGCLAGRDGQVRHFSTNFRGRKGSEGGGRELSEEQVARLSELISRVPPGPSASPPEGRRLVLHTFGPEGERLHGYDLADAPSEVMEIVRLSGSGIPSWTLQIKPDEEWQAHDHDEGGIVVLPKSQQLITCAGSQPLKLWDCATHRLIREVVHPAGQHRSVHHLAISPDERVVALMCSSCMILDTGTWKEVSLIKEIRTDSVIHGFNNPVFTADSKFLFLRTGAPITGFFDTTTWQPVPSEASDPEKIVKLAVLDADNGRLAMTKDGKLWMLAQGNLWQGVVGENARDFCSSLSRDRQTLATAVGVANRSGRCDFTIQLRHAITGSILKELRPFEQVFDDQRVHAVWWSPDGGHVFAGLESGEVAIWNARTGRHRATLSGTFGHVNGYAVTPEGSQVFLFVASGKIYAWTMERILEETRAFEASLGE